MEPHQSTTPFGRRSLTLAHVANQATAKARPPEKAVHKWQVFRAICTAKARVGVSERALAVLDALLSFHPGDHAERRWPDRVPLQPAARAARPWHGAGDAAAASGGLGRSRPHHSARQPERQALRPQRAGRAIEMAFGFDLSPLVARAEEFEAWAEDVRAEERALRLVRERITLCRRDIAKMIATGVEEGVPTRRAGQGPSDWAEIHGLYRGILARIPRTATRGNSSRSPRN